MRFALTNDFLPYGPNFRRGAEYLRQALGRVGIQVNIRAQDFPTYIRRVYTERDFDFANAWLGNSFDPTVGVQRLFWSRNFRKGVPFSNGAHYANAQVDQWLEQAAIAADPDRRVELFRRFQHQVVQDLPHLDLVAQRNVTVVHTRVQDATTGVTGLRASFGAAWLATA
ncbi:MAG: Periplasmic dipeptide transport protein [Paracidovorax wautersii]|uniref:Periplasmic dipeptide transport protein n=1 Tax=Paracidovorax wautersii TaxID=1177982 RepID=A0A7V8JPS9_9BURK|nr:MAG: Periplasmic dipeptide transport protein [Paracidovorax wautersii]